MKHLRKLLYAGLAAVFTTAMAAPSKDGTDYDLLRKLNMAEVVVSRLYVDSVDQGKLVEDAIRGMLSGLDPHSTYSTPKEVKTTQEALSGNFDGIGVQFNMLNDTLFVIQTITDGPSEKVGVLAGDRIVSVNDTAIAGVKMSKEEIMKRLRGPKGTKVKIGVCRHGMAEQLYFNITRDKIPVNTVEASYMIRPGVGYIRISSFGSTTHDEFVQSLTALQKKGMKNLIIDLQENGGGYLQAAVDILNEILSPGDLIVYTQGLHTGRREYTAKGDGKMRTGDIAVLVNEFSASAAEILTGAVQDQDRGIVVGRRTFGKGLVQRPVDLFDGSQIRITVAHYYTPSGRCIQKPYVKGDNEKYQHELADRFKNGEFTNADSIHFADSLKYTTLKKHRTVYGGGGIMPDYFVPLDTSRFTPCYRKLSAKSIVLNNSLAYNEQHGDELLRRYGKDAEKAYDKFAAEYEVPQTLIDKIMAEGEKQDIKPADDAERQRTRQQVAETLKALVARNLWTMTEYFRITNERNDIVRKALQQLGEL